MTAGFLSRLRWARGAALAVTALVLAAMVAQFPFAQLAHQGLLASGGSLPFPFTLAASRWCGASRATWSAG